MYLPPNDFDAHSAINGKAGKKRRRHQIDPAARWDFLTHIMRDGTQTPSALPVAISLLTRLNDDTGECFPDVARIALDTGLKKTAVLDALYGPKRDGTRGLISAGWFTVVRRKQAGHSAKNEPNRYRANLAKAGITGCAETNPRNPLLVRVSDQNGAVDTSPGSEIRSDRDRKSDEARIGNPTPDSSKGELSEVDINAKSIRFSAAGRHEGVLWLTPEMLAEGDAIRANYMNRPIKIPVPVGIEPSPEQVNRLVNAGITEDRIAASVEKWRTKFAKGRRTAEEWNEKLDAWLSNERLPAATPNDAKPIDSDWWPSAANIEAQAYNLKMTPAEVTTHTRIFVAERLGAPGFKGLSTNWVSTWDAEMQKIAARIINRRTNKPVI